MTTELSGVVENQTFLNWDEKFSAPLKACPITGVADDILVTHGMTGKMCMQSTITLSFPQQAPPKQSRQIK